VASGIPAEAAAARNPIYGQAFAQLDQINVPALHQQGLSGRGVVVCLLDVGFRWDHEVFRLSQLLRQWDFVFGDADVRQDAANPKDFSDAHGTATWSLLGGFKFGTMMGPAFGADILLGKTEVGSSETPIEEDYWAAGIEWAESLGAEVVSSSLGYTDWYTFKDMDGKTAVTTKAANRAVSLGVVVVNAAGNERRNAWAHIIAPADGFGVIAVGAVDAAGKIASFSSPGPTYDGRIKPEVCAFGVSNWVAAKATDGGDTYVTDSGTSYATPLVAGVVALLLEAHRDWTPAQVRDALMKTANNSAAPNNDYGWGTIDAAAAAAYRAPTPEAARPAPSAKPAPRIR
jgi:subtilisin family serine protease